jgi:hypothetical protein
MQQSSHNPDLIGNLDMKWRQNFAHKNFRLVLDVTTLLLSNKEVSREILSGKESVVQWA